MKKGMWKKGSLSAEKSQPACRCTWQLTSHHTIHVHRVAQCMPCPLKQPCQPTQTPPALVRQAISGLCKLPPRANTAAVFRKLCQQNYRKHRGNTPCAGSLLQLQTTRPPACQCGMPFKALQSLLLGASHSHNKQPSLLVTTTLSPAAAYAAVAAAYAGSWLLLMQAWLLLKRTWLLLT